jgi:hypothetical protein
VTGGQFTLAANSVALFQPVATAAGLTAQEYAAKLYDKVANDFSQYLGADWKTQTAFQSEVSNFDFTPSQSQIAELTNDGNATWTDGELKSALSLTALQPSSDTSLGTTAPNISGGKVTLTASNGVGSLADPIHITVDELTTGNLSGDQERAIALAKNPGDIVFTGVDAANNVVHFSGSQVPDGVTITGVDIQQAAPVFIAASDEFNASVQQGGVFAQATGGDLKLGAITAQAGDINLAAPGSIVAAHAGTSPVIVGGNITLLAASGDIGGTGAPLIYTGTSLASISAGRNIALQASGVDMVVGRVFAGGDVALSAPDGSILTSFEGVAVQADNLSLSAREDIGASTHPFTFQLSPDGVLNGNAGGAATLIATGNLDVDSFLAADDLSITALGDLDADDLKSTNGNLTVASGNDLTLNTANGHGSVTITAVNDLSLGTATSGMGTTIDAGGDGSITTLDAGGSLSVTTTGDLSLGTATSGGTMTVSADGKSNLITLHSGGALSITAGSDITVAATGSLDSGDSFTLQSGGALTMGANATISSVKQASITATGTAILGQVKTLFDGDHAIDITAASIAADGDGQTNLVATATNAKIYLAAQSGIGASSQYLYVDTPWISPITVAGGIYIHALSDIAMPDIHAPGEVQFISDHSLTLGDVDAVGVLGLSAGDDLVFGNLTTGGNATLGAGNAISGHSLTAAGSATVTAGLGSFQIDILSAADLTLTSLGDLDIPSITINGPVLISAPNITAHIANGGAGPLQIDVTGTNGGTAHNADLEIDSANGVLFGHFFADNGTIVTNAGHVLFQNGHVTHKLLLTTPFTNLFMNNDSPTPVRNVTEQFFAPGKTFFLEQTGTTTLTDAYLVSFGAGYTVLTIDSNGNISPALSLVQVGSMPLSAPTWMKIFMQNEDGLGGLILTDPWFGDIPDFGIPDEWITSLDGGVALNLGQP